MVSEQSQCRLSASCVTLTGIPAELCAYPACLHLCKAIVDVHCFLSALLLISVHTQLACLFTMHLSSPDASSQTFLWLESLLLSLGHTELGRISA